MQHLFRPCKKKKNEQQNTEKASFKEIHPLFLLMQTKRPFVGGAFKEFLYFQCINFSSCRSIL